jgi:hypothetical protein
MTERKLSILRTLLARVQERTSRSRPAEAAPSTQAARAEPAAQLNALTQLEDEVTGEAVPPSAPRMREAAIDALSEDNLATQKHQVVPDVDARTIADAEELDEEMDIAITVSDSDDAEVGEMAAESASFSDAPPSDEGAPGGLVLENETPLPGIAGEAPPAPARDELSWPPAAPSRPPPPVEIPAAAAPSFEPSPAFEPPRTEALAAAPAFEASPAGPPFIAPSEPFAPASERPPAFEAPTSAFREVVPAAEPLPSLADVTPEIHRAPVLRGPVGIFIEQSRIFSPNSFGELLEASLGLGRDA